MSFLEYHILHTPTLGHHEAVPKIDNSRVINGETFSLPTSDILLDLLDASILQLGCLDLILESGFDL